MTKNKIEKLKKLYKDIEEQAKRGIYGEIKVVLEDGHPTSTTIVSNKKY